jgi:hypothetical protein
MQMKSCPEENIVDNTISSLSPGRKWLLRIMQELNFGKVDGVIVLSGEPVIDSSTHVVREIKFGGDNKPRKELLYEDFVLKKECLDLFSWLSDLRDGTVVSIEVKHGLPFRMSIEEEVQNLVH